MSGGNDQLVLAFLPFTRGYGFVLFEGSDKPFDWAVKEIKEKHKGARALEDAKQLIRRYRPYRIVIEDLASGWVRRSSWIRKLYRLLSHLAEREGIALYRCSKQQFSEYFGTVSKHELAKIVAVQLPGLAHRIPPQRKVWTADDPRQALFDAAALGLLFYGLEGGAEGDASSLPR